MATAVANPIPHQSTVPPQLSPQTKSSVAESSLVIIKKTGEDGVTIDLFREEITFGSDEDCNIRIKKPSVAPKHAKMFWPSDSQHAWMENLSSSHQTLINGKPMSSPVLLRPGDLITVCDRSFRYQSIKPLSRNPSPVSKRSPLAPKNLNNLSASGPAPSPLKKSSIPSKKTPVATPIKKESNLRPQPSSEPPKNDVQHREQQQQQPESQQLDQHSLSSQLPDASDTGEKLVTPVAESEPEPVPLPSIPSEIKEELAGKVAIFKSSSVSAMYEKKMMATPLRRDIQRTGVKERPAFAKKATLSTPIRSEIRTRGSQPRPAYEPHQSLATPLRKDIEKEGAKEKSAYTKKAMATPMKKSIRERAAQPRPMYDQNHPTLPEPLKQVINSLDVSERLASSIYVPKKTNMSTPVRRELKTKAALPRPMYNEPKALDTPLQKDIKEKGLKVSQSISQQQPKARISTPVRKQMGKKVQELEQVRTGRSNGIPKEISTGIAEKATQVSERNLARQKMRTLLKAAIHARGERKTKKDEQEEKEKREKSDEEQTQSLASELETTTTTASSMFQQSNATEEPLIMDETHAETVATTIGETDSIVPTEVSISSSSSLPLSPSLPPNQNFVPSRTLDPLFRESIEANRDLERIKYAPIKPALSTPIRADIRRQATVSSSKSDERKAAVIRDVVLRETWQKIAPTLMELEHTIVSKMMQQSSSSSSGSTVSHENELSEKTMILSKMIRKAFGIPLIAKATPKQEQLSAIEPRAQMEEKHVPLVAEVKKEKLTPTRTPIQAKSPENRLKTPNRAVDVVSSTTPMASTAATQTQTNSGSQGVAGRSRISVLLEDSPEPVNLQTSTFSPAKSPKGLMIRDNGKSSNISSPQTKSPSSRTTRSVTPVSTPSSRNVSASTSSSFSSSQLSSTPKTTPLRALTANTSSPQKLSKQATEQEKKVDSYVDESLNQQQQVQEQSVSADELVPVESVKTNDGESKETVASTLEPPSSTHSEDSLADEILPRVSTTRRGGRKSLGPNVILAELQKEVVTPMPEALPAKRPTRTKKVDPTMAPLTDPATTQSETEHTQNPPPSSASANTTSSRPVRATRGVKKTEQENQTVVPAQLAVSVPEESTQQKGTTRRGRKA